MGDIERVLTLAADPGRVWDVIVCGDWLGDDGLIDPRPGGDGWVREGEDLRHVVVDAVDSGRRLVFRWWSIGPEGVGPASRVSVSVDVEVEADDEPPVTRVVVVESALAGSGPMPRSEPQAMALAAY